MWSNIAEFITNFYWWMADYFWKVAYFSIYSKRSQKEPKNRKKPNEIFGIQTKSKGAKIEKFGSFNAKLATLICDRYFFKLSCFKLIGWFYHHIVFPPITSVCYRFLHCDYRKLHCDYKKLHCCLRLTAVKSINHSWVIFLCILLIV
jgi:hypothetical protein